jgi:plastocyanin
MSKSHVIEIHSMSFMPNSIEIVEGDTVAWRNSDEVPHTATADAVYEPDTTDGVLFDTGEIAPGATSTPITIWEPGRWPFPGHFKIIGYHCSLHLEMRGTITANQGPVKT